MQTISVAMMPMGTSRCGFLAFFGGGGDGIEADVGEEDDRAAGEHARPAVGHEGMPVGGMNEAATPTKMKTRMADDLQQHHDVVGLGRFADAAHQHHGQQHDDEERRDVEAEVPAGRVEHRCRARSLRPRGQVGGRDPSQGGMDAEPVEQIDACARRSRR